MHVYISISISHVRICENALLLYKGSPVSMLKELLPLGCSALEGSPAKSEGTSSSPTPTKINTSTHPGFRFFRAYKISLIS